jgi:hypothetical protein
LSYYGSAANTEQTDEAILDDMYNAHKKEQERKEKASLGYNPIMDKKREARLEMAREEAAAKRAKQFEEDKDAIAHIRYRLVKFNDNESLLKYSIPAEQKELAQEAFDIAYNNQAARRLFDNEFAKTKAKMMKLLELEEGE